MYHKISTDSSEEPNHTLVALERFEEQMRYLAEQGYTTVHLEELAAHMRGERALPEKSVALTFDDGWKSVLNALPILEKHRLKATFFMVTGYLDGNYPAFLRWPDLEKIAANPNYEIGAHSITHPWDAGDNLAAWAEGRTRGKSVKDAEAEIFGPKQELEAKLGRPVRAYAWPSGWYSEQLIGIARQAGYTALATTEEGLNRPGADPMAMKRYPVYGSFDLDQFKQLLSRDMEDTRVLFKDKPGQAPRPEMPSIPVLMYHRVTDAQEAGDVAIPPARFKEQMRHLKEKGYRTLSIAELAEFMQGKREFPEKSVVLTFDDGWKEMLDVAPVLQEHGFKATFLIITGAADGVFGSQYLNWEEIQTLARNPDFEFGSHTLTHPWDEKENLLTWLEEGRREKERVRVFLELRTSKAALESRLGRPVPILAWPKGWYSPELIRHAQDAGYRILLTINERPNHPGRPVTEVNRFFVHGTWDLRTFGRLVETASRSSKDAVLEKP
jgi:peptidoglycan/xylan/chitin deacetylase (PgdA/CDA1 family)